MGNAITGDLIESLKIHLPLGKKTGLSVQPQPVDSILTAIRCPCNVREEAFIKKIISINAQGRSDR